MSVRVGRILYRSLIRRAQQFDRYPLLKVWCDYPPKKWYSPEVSFTKEVRKAFRRPLENNNTQIDLLSEGFRVYRRWSTVLNHASKNVKLFDMYLKMCSYNNPPSTSITNPPPNHIITFPQNIEPGTLLLAHPRWTDSWNHSVLLVLRHNEHGTLGVILNDEFGSRLEGDEIRTALLEATGEGEGEEVEVEEEDEDEEDEGDTTSESLLNPSDHPQTGEEDEEEEGYDEYEIYEDEGEEEDEEGTEAGTEADEDEATEDEDEDEHEHEASHQHTTAVNDIQKVDSRLVLSTEEDPSAGGGLILLHSSKGHDQSHHIADGLYYTVPSELSSDTLRSLLSNHFHNDLKCRNYRVFEGYEWSPNQLQAEIEKGWWFLVRCPLRILFKPISLVEELSTVSLPSSQEKARTEPVGDSNEQAITSITTPPLSLSADALDFSDDVSNGKLWAKLLELMGGEYYHFSHLYTLSMKSQAPTPPPSTSLSEPHSDTPPTEEAPLHPPPKNID